MSFVKIPSAVGSAVSGLAIRVHANHEVEARIPELEGFLRKTQEIPLSLHPAWLQVMRQGLGHATYCVEAVEGSAVRGFLPLAHVQSWLFGNFLVSLPYLNYGGYLADHDAVATALVDRAVALAEELGVRYLELRHVWPLSHAKLNEQVSSKVHMRLSLPDTPGKLWDGLNAKVRNQVRKGQKSDLQTVWGRHDLLPEFYAIFCRNMRDLGTPVYGKRLFRAILDQFPERAELCVVRSGGKAVAGALLLHGWGVTEVPSASCLREANASCANMLMYWHLLERAVLRGQEVFDFGRSSLNSNTHRFKKQWGADAFPANWQYYLRKGQVNQARPDNPRYGKMIRIWQRLPVWVTRLIGPGIVRGIP
jgi:FemAB-related protein (PEP-CTERM system-associated)